MGNGGWCVSKCRLCCAGSPLASAALHLISRGGSRGTAEVSPVWFKSLQACGSGCNIQGPSAPWQEAAARQWLRPLWLRSWRGWLPPPAAFSGGKKDQRAPEQSRTVGHQRAGIFPPDARRFPSPGVQNALPWLLPMAVPASCFCSDAEGSPMSPFMPCHTTPKGLKQLLYLLCLWEYLFLQMGTGTFHLGHGNKGEQADLGLHGPHLPLPNVGPCKSIGRCLLQLFGQDTLCSFSAALLSKGQPLTGTQPCSGGCTSRGCHRVGEAQTIGPGIEGGSCWQVLQHLADPGKYGLFFSRNPGSTAAKFVDWRNNQPFWACPY